MITRGRELMSSEEKDSTDAFSVDHGHLHTKMGLRPSRSFDMLVNRSKEEGGASEGGGVTGDGGVVNMLSASINLSHSLPYGASPK